MIRSIIMLITLLMLLWAKKTYGLTCSSVKSGNFTDATVWSCGRVPIGGDTIIIANGTTVTINANINLYGSKVTMKVFGNLYFIKKLYLPANSCVQIQPSGQMYGDGSGSNSDMLYIDGINLWAGECNGNGGMSYAYCGTVSGFKTICDESLPVRLVYFQAKKLENIAFITWAAADENEVAYYQLEESKDLLEFKTIATTVAGSYKYYVSASYTGFSYYRLTITNKDYSTSRSSIIYLSDNDSSIAYHYDAGTHSLVVVNVQSCEIFDVTGKSVYKNNSVTNPIDLGLLKAGPYMIVLSNGTETLKEKINIY